VRVFVTGGTGYVGAHLVRALVARGHRVTVLARDVSRIPSFVGADGITIVRGDVRDAIDDAITGHDALIHNALVWPDEPTELELEDPRAALRVFLAAERAGVQRLLYTSSTAVHRPFRPRMTEDDALAPDDLYGMTKAMGELALATVAQRSGLVATVIRSGPVVGAPATRDAPFKSDRRFEDFVARARRGEPIVVARNDGRQFVGASDLALVFAAALERANGRATFLAVAREFVTWESIARETVRRIGSGDVVVEDGGLPPTPWRFDTGTLERELGLALTAEPAVLEHIEDVIARSRG
jgi:UDP-glucose 4-epimerase